MGNETSKHTPGPGAPSEPTGAPGWKRRLVFAAVVSAAMAFTLCFFGPLDLFFNNHEELWFHLQDIIGGVAVTSLLFFAGATLAGTLLRGRPHSVYMALLFGCLLGTWVQGSFMNKNYGALNGTSINWGAYTGYGVVNTLVWMVCIALPLILMLVLKEKKLRPVLIFLSCALILMQGASLAVSYINYPDVKSTSSLSKEGIYTLSKKENIVLFVLDTLDERYYRDFIKDNPDYKEVLQGFTQYDNALAPGARTQVAMPLILSGLPRTEPGTFTDYINYTWEHQTLFRDLDKAGYDVRLFTESKYVAPSAADFVDNLALSGNHVTSHFGLTKKLYKLTLYKYVPHFLKWRFWMYTGDFDRYMADNEYSLDDAKFNKNFQKAGGFTYTGGDRAFRLYHMMGAHKRYTLTTKGNRTKEKQTSRRRQVKGCFTILKNMLEDMKKNGAYENASIFILADHGDKRLCQWPTLLYKPAGAAGAYRTSDAPVSFLDLTATVDSLAGGDSAKVGSGRTLDDIKPGEKRTRNFYYNIGSNATFVTGEFATTAHASDGDALKLVKKYQVSDASSIPDYQLGTKLSFAGNVATANIYCTHGFRTATNTTTHMEGRYGQLVIPIASPPSDGKLKVTMKISTVINPTPMEIRVGNQLVCQRKLTKKDSQSVISFLVPVSGLKDGKLTLDFTFPGIPEQEEDKDAGTRMRSIKVSTLCVSQDGSAP